MSDGWVEAAPVVTDLDDDLALLSLDPNPRRARPSVLLDIRKRLPPDGEQLRFDALGQRKPRPRSPDIDGQPVRSAHAGGVLRQTLESASGENRELTRVLDVRLRRAGGPWLFDRIASVGGSPVPRPDSLPPAAVRALDSPNITMSDSARWDVHRGAVDTALLSALANAARDHRLSIAVFRAGHPRNVWETTRASAHSRGFAADIYAVDGRLVITQRLPEGPAYELAGSLYADGATQLGSPWTFGAGGARSFTDAVHQDHIHVQQSPVS